jgi:hypothetical protein
MCKVRLRFRQKHFLQSHEEAHCFLGCVQSPMSVLAGMVKTTTNTVPVRSENQPSISPPTVMYLYKYRPLEQVHELLSLLLNSGAVLLTLCWKFAVDISPFSSEPELTSGVEVETVRASTRVRIRSLIRWPMNPSIHAFSSYKHR